MRSSGLLAADADVDIDRELVLMAQAGDVSCLGHLLERHRPGMMAVALGMLRHPPEAQDAVQDAMLAALRRIGDVRDPGSAGPWLREIVRNCCRMRLRARVPVPVADPVAHMAAMPLPGGGDGYGDPADALERHAARDWVWHAVESLSPPLRLVTMLRYFTDIRSYEQIAAASGVPVGTVRSRLSQARAKLSGELLAASSAPHHDVAALTAARRQEAEEGVFAGARGRFGEFLRETWHPEVDTVLADGRQVRGTRPLVEVMDSAMEAGIRQRLAGIVASRDIVIWEMEVRNLADHPSPDPLHCPSRPFWLLFLEDGRVRRFRQFAGQPAPGQPSAVPPAP